MELREALTQIAEIRQQMARTEMFRGYRAAPVALSGGLALGAAALQAVLIPNPTEQITAYLILWFGAAALSLLASAGGMVLRHRYLASHLQREITWLAVEQFVPALAAGALLTLVLVLTSPESVWMLPGLWQMLFSLGIFASYRLLPRPMVGVAVFYLAAGAVTLALGRGDAALTPWAMGVPFGVGQLLVAAVLYWSLERCHEPS
jgi:hypothetical protein